MDCLDELTVLAMVEGRLAPAAGEIAEAHVDSCPACRELLAAVATTDVQRSAPAEPSLEPGEVVGRYLILHRVGGGGMGEVYAAWDPDLDRRVALKVVAKSAARDPTAEARLVREAKATASISHRNVIGVYEVGRVLDRIFIAMEFMDAGTLTAWLCAGDRSDWRAILDRFLAAGEGLAAAHAAGLIHRDFKPDNVLLGHGERIVVTDFGLARSPPADPTDEGVAGERALQTHAAGTPAYMAPEQLRGAEITARADQFGFCVALWEALYGTRPFGGDSIEALLEAVQTNRLREGTGPSRVPAAIRKELLRGLASDPGGRHPSVTALLAALRRAATSRRRLTIVVMTGVVALALGGAFVVGRAPACTDGRETWEEAWGPETRERLRGEFEATGASYSATTFDHFEARMSGYRDDWARAYQAACVAARDRETVVAANARTACLERARDTALDLLGVLAQPDRPRLQMSIGEVLRLPRVHDCESLDGSSADRERAPNSVLSPELENAQRATRMHRYDEARAQLDEIEIRAQEIGDDATRARVDLVRGSIGFAVGEYEQSRADLLAGTMLAVEAASPAVAAQGFVALMAVDGHLGRPEWVAHWEAMARAMLAQLGEVTREHARLAYRRAYGIRQSGDHRAARAAYEYAVEISDETFGPDHPDSLNTRTQLAFEMSEMGENDAALAQLEEVLARQLAIFGETNRDVAFTLEQIGYTLGELGRRAEALEYHDRSLALLRQVFGERHLTIAMGMTLRCIHMLGHGDDAHVLAQLEEALAMGRETAGGSHRRLWTTQHYIGRAHMHLGDLERARDLWRALLTEMSEGEDDASMAAMTNHYLGVVLGQLGDHAGAHEHLRRAEAAARKAYGEGHVATWYPRIEDAMVSVLEGELDPTTLERALEFDRHTSLGDYAPRARFYLARTLVAAHRERARAVALAVAAHARATMSDPPFAREIAAWLAVEAARPIEEK
jgi:eukaryotic-like serine/threonine-protein kinase